MIKQDILENQVNLVYLGIGSNLGNKINNIELAKFLKQNIYGKKIVVGMGAGSISNWMKKLPELM